MQQVLVLCTGNSCRSIMAEALINHLAAGRYQAVSAGSKPSGFVHPQTLKTLEKHGVDLGSPYSKSWDVFAEHTFDLVITVCAAAAESCPVFLGNHAKKHWPLPDPAAAVGSASQIEAAFDEVFHELKQRIERELL